MHTEELLAAYDEQVRRSFSGRIPSSWTATGDGPITRCHTEHEGFVLAADGLHTWSPAELDALVARTVAHYAEDGLGFEWKTFAHDNPALTEILASHGFTADSPETLILGEVDALTGPELRIDGDPPVMIRVGGLADLPAVAAMEEAVWGHSWDWFVPEMTARLTDNDPTHLVLAQDGEGGKVVSAGWLVPMPGTDIAGLWGGSTLAEYRGRGIYRAIVRARANQAARLGVKLLQVDATEDSRPILERLGLTAIGTTTPYHWRP